MKRKSNKKLTIALLALLGVVSTAGTYAYWAAGVSAPANNSATNTITIGASTGEVKTAITLGFSSDSTDKLVPAGFVEDGQIASITHTYGVSWVNGAGEGETNYDKGNKAEKSGKLTAVATVTAATRGNDESGDPKAVSETDLITIKKLVLLNTKPETDTIEKENIKLYGDAVEVAFEITLAEPADKAEYDAVINAVVTIEVVFTIEPVED